MMIATKLVILLFTTYALPPCCWCTCNSLLTMSKAFGHYCKYSDVMLPWSISLHECNWLCIQKPTCMATNYNTSEDRCALLSAPCLQASSDTQMIYTMFTDVPHDLCIEWVDFTPGTPIDKRWGLTKYGGDNLRRVIAIINHAGDVYPAYMSPPHKKCFGTDGLVQFTSSTDNRCQVLRVQHGCTIGFVSYTAGDILPTNAVGLKSQSDGTVRYIAIIEPTAFPGRFIGGHYTVGTPAAFISYGGIKQGSQMQLLLII